MSRSLACLLVCAAVLPAACKARTQTTTHPEPTPSASASAAHGHPAPHASAKPGKAARAPTHADHPASSAKTQFLVPFAWEADQENAFAKGRSFLKNLMDDNESFARASGAPHFRAFAETQKPRATIVACSDSRVQSVAIDASPENDLFTIRNIGNQITSSAGSVAYGVHHLKTPVLLILGHTGCGAVKAAMKDYKKEGDALKKELDTLTFDRPKGSVDNAAVWKDAVIANVNAQVREAFATYAHEIEVGDLMVVGAVYDFRGDLEAGPGRVTFVNVNGNTEPAKVASFSRAVKLTAAVTTRPPAAPPSASVWRPLPH